MKSLGALVDPGLGWLLGGEESLGDIQAAGIVLCVLVDIRMCPAHPQNVVWVLECARRGVSSRSVPSVDAEVK